MTPTKNTDHQSKRPHEVSRVPTDAVGSSFTTEDTEFAWIAISEWDEAGERAGTR